MPSLPPNRAELVWLRVKGGAAATEEALEEEDPGRETVDSPKEEAELVNLDNRSDVDDTEVGEDGIEIAVVGTGLVVAVLVGAVVTLGALLSIGKCLD
jgi:hypothetical protein